MRNRILCAFLAICMVLTLFPVEALAAPEDNGGNAEAEDASEAAIEEASEAEPVVTTDAVALMPVAEESAEEEPATEKPPPVREVPAVAALMNGESGADNQGLIASGTCGSQGDNLTWTLDSSGLLTVSGKGDMANYRSWWESSPVPPWNAYLSQITAVAIEPGVTSIGSGAFYGFSGVASLTLPDTLKSIGSAAFAECASLKNLTIPGSVKSVTSGCFQSCTGLESVTLSEGVSVIDGGAFYGCSSLVNLNLPNGLLGIGGGAFADCASLASLTFPDGVGGMGDGAFSGCTGLKSVTFPDSLNSISTSCFSGCTALTELSLPDNMTDIGWYAFQSCSGLKKVKLPKKIRSIGNLAFRGCSSLEEIELPAALDVLADEAFAYCTSLKKVKFCGDISIVSPATFANCTSLETVIFADEVTYIRGSSMFGGCTSLTSLTLPKNLKHLELNACNVTSLEIPNHVISLYLFGCTGLTSITIPDGVRECGFYNCAGLTSVTLPDSVTSIGRSAFSGCTGLTSVTIPNSVTSIGENAFSGCTGLTSITIPDGVTEIGGSAFSGCTGLTSITIPDSVTEIGRSALSDCAGLTSVTIPNGVTEIGYYVFQGCIGLTSITIPDDVTVIHRGAFENCTSLVSVALPDNLTVIGDADGNWWDRGAFENCSSLTSITIPNSVTGIGAYAFEDCTSLTSVTIPSAVTHLGAYAFYGCTDLTSVTILDGLTEIGDHSFDGCAALTSVTIADSVTAIYRSAFADCTSLASVALPRNLTLLGSDNESWWDKGVFENCSSLTSITVPDSVTSIGMYTFRGCTGLTSFQLPDYWPTVSGIFEGCAALTSVTIPDGVASIGDSALSGCTGLTSVTIPDSVTSIGYSAFDGCAGLTSITIPYGVTSIKSGTFSGCAGLASITIPDSVTFIDYYAFNGCTGLTSIIIPDSVTSIENAFVGCTGLTSITIPNSVTSVELSGCTGLTSLTIPNGVTSLWLSDCTGLTSITIPDSVTSIGLRGCTGLTSVTIPDSVTSIGDYAFYGCTGLTSISIPDNVTSIGYEAFQGCTGLTSVAIPEGVTSIEWGAFYGCTGLTSVTIPDSVTYISRCAFCGCTNLTSVTIPNSASIGSEVFSGCTALTSLIIPEAVESIDWGAFENCDNLTLYVFPDSYGEQYAKDNNLKFRYLADSVFVTLTVKVPDGSVLTDGFTVDWQDESGAFVAEGTSVGLDKGGCVFYQVSLGEDFSFLYAQPEKQMLELDVDKMSIEAVCTLSALSAVAIRGQVVGENGAAVSGAAVTVKQTANQRYARTQSVTTDADGYYSMEGFPFPTTVMVSADGYYTARKSFSVTVDEQTYSAEDIVMTAVPENRFTLSLKRRDAVEKGVEPTLTTLSNADGLSFTAYNVTRDKEISGEVLQYPYLVLGSQAGADDVIRVSVTDENNAMTMEPTETVYGGEPNQEWELTLVENGHIAATLSGPKRIRAMLFDEKGAFIRQYADNGAAFDSGSLTAGKYQVVFMENSSLLSAVPDLARLDQLGLENGKDYVLKSADVENGVINALGSVKVPALDLQRFVIVEKAYTSVTVNKARVAAGQVVAIRVQYKLQDRYKDGAGQLILELPANCVLLNGGVSVNGSGAKYALDGRSVKINLASDSGVVTAYVSPETAGNYTVSCFLNWTMPGGVTTLQSVGSAFFEAYAMKINAPEKTSEPNITVSGQSYSGGKVTVYDNGEPVGSATVRAGGTWVMPVKLTDYFLYGFHDLYAVVETKDGRRAVSETATVIYDSTFVELDSIIMLYNGQRIESKFHNDAKRTEYYTYVPSYPYFTFIVTPDPKAKDPTLLHDVTVATRNGEGAETRIPCQYQEGAGWVGNATFTTEQLPVEVWAEYVCDAKPEIMNAEMEKRVYDDMVKYEETLYDDETREIHSDNVTATENGFTSDAVVDTNDEPMNLGVMSIDFFDISDFNPVEWMGENYVVTEYEDGATEYAASWIENHTLFQMYAYPAESLYYKASFDMNQLDAVGNGTDSSATDSVWYKALKILNDDILVKVPESFSELSWTYPNVIPHMNVENIETLQEFAVLRKAIITYQNALREQLSRLIKKCAAKCPHGDNRLSQSDLIKYDYLCRYYESYIAIYPYAATCHLASVKYLENLCGNAKSAAIAKQIGGFNKLIKLEKLLPNKISRFLVERGENILADTLIGQIGGRIGDAADKYALISVLKNAVSTQAFIERLYYSICSQIEGSCRAVEKAYLPCDDAPDDDVESTESVNTQAIIVSPIIDPSGYVCEAVPSKRLEGVTVTAWYRYENPETEEMEIVQWDAAEYDQTNPLTTNAEGGYAWDVPVGEWQVRFEKDGYESAQSDWLPVPPPQTEVNIALVSKAAPTLSGLSVYENEARLEFSQYMKPETVTAERVRVTADGNAVSGTVQAVNLEASFENSSVSYASAYRFLTDQSLEGEIAVTVDAGVENYAGTVMQSDATATAVVERKPVSLTAPKNIEIGVGDTQTITVQVLPEGAGANRKVSVASNAPDVISAGDGITDAGGVAQIPVSCLLPGSGELRFTLEGADLTAVTTVNYESVLESLDREKIPPITYALTVAGGTGSGEYEQDTEVTIKADESTGETRFKGWIGADNLEFVKGDNASMEATFKMPARALTLTATYDEIPSCTVIWLNGDGSELDRKTYKEGQSEPSTDKVPTKAADADNTYAFLKWDNGAAEGNVKTYKPEFASIANAVTVETVHVTGQTVQAVINCSYANATAYCAAYASNGKMLALKTSSVTNVRDYAFSFENQQFDYAKVFVLSADLRPLCASVVSMAA